MHSLIQYVDANSGTALTCLELNGDEPTSTSQKFTNRGHSAKMPPVAFLETTSTTFAKSAFASASVPPICYEIATYICPQHVREVTFDSCLLSCLISTTDHRCAIKGDAHRGNHIYYIVHLRRFSYQQRCHARKGICERVRHTPDTPLPERFGSAIQALIDSQAEMPPIADPRPFFRYLAAYCEGTM